MHEGARAAIDAVAFQAYEAIKRVDIQKSRNDPFETERVIVSKITDKDLVAEPTAWVPTKGAGMAYVFIHADGAPYGLSEESYDLVDELIGRLLKIKWVKGAISDKFILNSFVQWARFRYSGRSEEVFLAYFLDQCDQLVRTQTVWMPIQHLEVQAEFDFGAARIVPMTKAWFDRLEAEVGSFAAVKPEDAKALFNDMRGRMQGFAAVVINIEAEPSYATTAGRNICEEAVGLLRFFSRASISSSAMCPITLLDAFKVPLYHALITQAEDGFSYEQGIIPQNVAYWRLSKDEIIALKSENLDQIGALLDEASLNEFGRNVRSAVLSFTRALTFPELSDRVLFALSAVEGLLLRDSGEPIQQNVGDRMAFLVAGDTDGRRAVVENLKSAYKVRSQYIHHRVSAVDAKELDIAFQTIRAVLATAVSNIGKFSRHSEFIDAVERLKYGG